MANIGVLPHADLPHILPFFRLARELGKLGHRVHLLGSDVLTVSKGHSEAWAGCLHRYNLGASKHLHCDSRTPFHAWLKQVIADSQLDVLIVDAVWQALSYALADLPRTVTVVHHAGLPDFRTQDMPAREFVHPAHPRETWQEARRRIEERERTGPGVRRLLSSLNPDFPTGSQAAKSAFGCGEFAALPAIRAMSLCPAAEFPAERGRVEYLGSLLPKPDDMDWQAPPAAAILSSQPLIACVFGTTGLQTRQERQWLLACSRKVAREFAHCQVISVIPGRMRSGWLPRRLPSNLLILPWIPLWELLVSRNGAKVLVTTPGVGAFRDAIASATPMIAIPRRSDQFGAAARVEYFGLGSTWVSNDLPSDSILMSRIAQVLGNDDMRRKAVHMSEEVMRFDSTAPLKRFIDGICDGSIRPTDR